MNISGFSKIHVITGTPQEYIAQVNSALRRNRFPGLIEIALYSSLQNYQDVYGFTSWGTFEDYQQNRSLLIEQISQNIKIKRVLQEHHAFKLIWEHQLLSRPVGASSLNQLVFPEGYSLKRLDKFVMRLRRLRHELEDVRGVWIGRSLHEINRLLIRTDWSSEQAQLDFLSSDRYKEAEKFYEERGVASEYGSTKLQLIMQPGFKETDFEVINAKTDSAQN